MTPAQSNRNRRRGMHPMRDFDTLAADLARFDFSTRAGANVFYCHAAKSWTTGEIINMHGMKPRIQGYDPAEPSERRECVCLSRADGIAALARYGMTETEAGKAIVKTWKTHDAVLRFWVTRINPVALTVKTLDELYQEAQCEIAAAKDRGYLGAKRTHGGTMAEGVERLLEKTIRELQNAKAKPRNQHPRKKRGADGKAVTKTEAAIALGVSRQTVYNLISDEENEWGLIPAHLSSWKFFRCYLKERGIEAGANKRLKEYYETHLRERTTCKPESRKRKRRPDIRLTSTGRIDNAPDCKPHR